MIESGYGNRKPQEEGKLLSMGTQFMDTRVADTVKLAELAEHALEHDFNRQLTYRCIAELDQDGYHVLTIYVPDHTRAQKPADPPHHRVGILMKVRDSAIPKQAWLDVTEEDWSSLMTIDQVKG